jgi:glutamate/tyrosine decarboxylase-like PLP-dependent enzyme
MAAAREWNTCMGTSDAASGGFFQLTERGRRRLQGIERADSWATDAHKWLNVPYDSGLAFCAHPEAHRAAMTSRADYLVPAEHGERDAFDWTPEASRRARGLAVYAAIRSLGRSGIAELVDRCCHHARRFAQRLAEADGVEVCNDVVLNQVLVRFGSDDRTRDVIRRVQEDGTIWLGGTVWQGAAAMRISVSNWSTTTADVDRSVEAILRAAQP